VTKHDFDPLSLIFGLLFLLGGIPLLVSKQGLEFFDANWVFPAFLVVAGVIVLAASQFAKRDDDGSEESISHEDPWSG
jgi:uncharacterized membrane protein SirB2